MGGGSKAHQWKNDPYYKQAKSKGYRSRAAFKLQWIDEKFNIFKLGRVYARNILDLGCHPGSFIQVILEKYSQLVANGLAKSPVILGVDRTTTRPLEIPKPLDPASVTLLRADVLDPSFDETLKEWTESHGKFDVILSDLAPKTSGDFRDAALQEEMVERVFELLGFLRKGGNVVVKIFESPETPRLIEKYSKRFRVAKLTKPMASRKKSREKFIVGLDFSG